MKRKHDCGFPTTTENSQKRGGWDCEHQWTRISALQCCLLHLSGRSTHGLLTIVSWTIQLPSEWQHQLMSQKIDREIPYGYTPRSRATGGQSLLGEQKQGPHRVPNPQWPGPDTFMYVWAKINGRRRCVCTCTYAYKQDISICTRSMCNRN